jgi:hypothetical protein
MSALKEPSSFLEPTEMVALPQIRPADAVVVNILPEFLSAGSVEMAR